MGDLFSKNRRRAYRVGVQPQSPAIRLETTGGWREGELHDTSAGGCGAKFPSGTELSDGDTVKLELSDASCDRERRDARWLASSHRCAGKRAKSDWVRAQEAVVRFASRDSDGLRVGLEFKDVDDFYTHLPPSLTALFNRRTTNRHQTVPGLGFRLGLEGREVHGETQDLSIYGLGFRPSSKLESPSSELVEAWLKLSDGEEVRMVGRLRHAQTEVLGFELELRQTPDLEGVQSRIAQYVLHRQRAGIRT